MKFELLHHRTIPITYVLLTLQQAAERGVSRERLLRGLELPQRLLEQPEAKLSLLQYTQIIYRALQLTGDGSLGYEFALRCKLTAHGFFGYGLMSQSTLRDATHFGLRFVQLCTPCYSLRLLQEGERAVIDVREAIPFGPLRQYGFDMFLVCCARIAQELEVFVQRPRGQPRPSQAELYFAGPEPAYYARYREQLPPVRFDAGVNQLRFPESYLDAVIGTANPMTAQLVTGQCERELQALGLGQDLLARVRALLASTPGQYPTLPLLAARLFLSERTFKRRLCEHGVSYQQLLDEARRQDALRLLQNATLSVEDIAAQLGYSSSANFSRAFRKWTGATPGAWRREPLERAAS